MRNVFPSNKTNTTGDAQRQLGGGAVQAAAARQRNIYDAPLIFAPWFVCAAPNKMDGIGSDGLVPLKRRGR